MAIYPFLFYRVIRASIRGNWGRIMRRKNLETHHSKEDTPELEEAFQALGRSSMRRTRPRVAILKALIAHDGPFTVDEILSLKEARNLDRVTVYRCLSAFEEIRLIQRCEFGDGVSRYEYSRGDHHHHIVCKRCRKVESIKKRIPKALTSEVSMMGYQDVSHHLEFFGICKECVA